MARKIGLAAGDRQPRGAQISRRARSASVIVSRRGDRTAVFGRRLIAPVRDQVPARGGEEAAVGAPDRIDRDHPPALVDRQPERERRFFLGEQLRRRIGRLELGRRRQQLRAA